MEYVKTLEKPLIICGDFNVARDTIDIYPENLMWRMLLTSPISPHDTKNNLTSSLCFPTVFSCGMTMSNDEIGVIMIVFYNSIVISS